MNPLDVRFHQQDETNFCGDACLEMILNFMTGTDFDQDSLDSEIHKRRSVDNGTWASAPDQLATALTCLKPESFPTSIVVTPVTSKEALTAKVAWSIYNYKLPSIVLFNSSHWVIAYGFESTVAPVGSTDIHCPISSIYVKNPTEVPSRATPPPPHNSSDLCGTSIVRGLMNENLPIADWYSNLAPVTIGTTWLRKFVVISDPDPADASPRRRGTKKIRQNERLLTPAEAQTHAAALRIMNPLDGWTGKLSDGVAGQPWLVQRLDEQDSYYYTIPMFYGNSAPAILNVDAKSGELLRAGWTASPENNAIDGLNFGAEWARSKLLGQEIDLGRKGRITVREEAFSLYPPLVWRPCKESLSPFLPFFLANIGGHQIYLRVDGQIFTKLRNNDFGN